MRPPNPAANRASIDARGKVRLGRPPARPARSWTGSGSRARRELEGWSSAALPGSGDPWHHGLLSSSVRRRRLPAPTRDRSRKSEANGARYHGGHDRVVAPPRLGGPVPLRLLSCIRDRPTVAVMTTNERQVALVTGASRGIGKVVAQCLARAGYDVAITARTVNEGEEREHSLDDQEVEHQTAAGLARHDGRAGRGRGPSGDDGAGRPHRLRVARRGRRPSRGALGAHRRARQQRPLHRSRPHGPVARHADRSARQAAPGQRAGDPRAVQAGAARDDRPGRRNDREHHVRARGTPTR